MTQTFIILSQSVTGAVIFIVALLLVAALIGYLTAWFYAKSVYTPIINKLEEEKAGLIRQVDLLNDEVGRLNLKADELREKIGNLEGEITRKEKEIRDLTTKIRKA